MEKIRLQKYLAEAGVASRRKSEELINSGRVQVNGSIVNELGTKVGMDDDVKVDGKKIAIVERKTYIIVNKPVGYVSTVKDQFERNTVIDLVKDVKERVYPVGRLDYDTSGLLLLTNDGDFTYKLTHPKHEINKVYLTEISGSPSQDAIRRFKTGIKIEDYITSHADFKIITIKSNSTVVEITIHEGKNRQVRKMCEAIGHPVISLKRIAIGKVKLGDLKEGEWRYLRKDEINSLVKR